MHKPSEVAKELNVSLQTILRWVRDGKVKAIKLPSGTYRITGEEIARIKNETNIQIPPKNQH